jgi:hypothetical protein
LRPVKVLPGSQALQSFFKIKFYWHGVSPLSVV